MKLNVFLRSYTLLCLSIIAIGLSACAKQSDSLVIYSARKSHLIQPLLDIYTQKTGIEIQLLTGKAGALIQRIQSEGSTTPADILFTVDAGNLWQAKKMNLLQAVDSKKLTANIPDHLRDPQNYWFGFSMRARTIVYHPDRVDASKLLSYEDLASPKWKNRLVLRTSKKVYNQSLVAMMIKELGESKSTDVVSGWVKNLSTKVFSSDTHVLKAIDDGLGDIGIVNSYYYGRLKAKNPDFPLRLFWPDAQYRGVHVNISGAGITRHSKQPKAAQKFLEWLSTKEAQSALANTNYEYPVNPEATIPDLVKSWGVFSPSKTNLSWAGILQKDAIRLMDQVSYH